MSASTDIPLRRELAAELQATRRALTLLRLTVERTRPQPRPICQKPRQRAACLAVIELDALYAGHFGTALPLTAAAPPYTGGDVVSHHKFGSEILEADSVRGVALAAIERVRSGKSTGLLRRAGDCAIAYFSNIWPADLDWPLTIPRPQTMPRASTPNQET